MVIAGVNAGTLERFGHLSKARQLRLRVRASPRRDIERICAGIDIERRGPIVRGRLPRRRERVCHREMRERAFDVDIAKVARRAHKLDGLG